MQLPFGLDPASFCAGAGLVLVLALAAFVLNVWWRELTSPFRPQVLVQTTKRTPWQVVAGAMATVAQYLGLALAFAAVGLLLVFQFPFDDVKYLGLVGLILVAFGTLFKLIVR